MQSTVTTASTNTHAASDALGLWEPKRTLTLEAARKHSARIRLLRKLLVAASAALVAVRSASTSTAVDLTAPVLNFYRAIGAEPSKVTAAGGLYDDVENILNLTETVRLRTDDGYSCDTNEAKIFTKDKRISGNAPIACSGSFGEVSGNSYTITDDYTVYTFADGMSATVTRDAADDSNDDNFGFEGNAPINIKARTATYKSTTTTLSGDVDVKQGASRVTSDDMIIYRAKAQKNNDEAAKSLRLGAITQIDAKGNFLYVTPDRRLSGNRGIYDRQRNVITVTGDVVLEQSNGTVVTGNKLVYDMTRKRAKVGESCTGPNCDRFNFEIKRDNN